MVLQKKQLTILALVFALMALTLSARPGTTVVGRALDLKVPVLARSLPANLLTQSELDNELLYLPHLRISEIVVVDSNRKRVVPHRLPDLGRNINQSGNRIGQHRQQS